MYRSDCKSPKRGRVSGQSPEANVTAGLGMRVLLQPGLAPKASLRQRSGKGSTISGVCAAGRRACIAVAAIT